MRHTYLDLSLLLSRPAGQVLSGEGEARNGGTTKSDIESEETLFD